MKVRQATYDDAIDILDWRNDEHTRAMSKDSDVVDKDRHLAWFNSAISDPRRLILIGELCQNKIGMVRFDYKRGSWGVSINLSPSMRGRGYGFTLLEKGITLLRDMGNMEEIFAEVRAENISSMKMFEQCGFAIFKKDDDYFYMSLKIL